MPRGNQKKQKGGSSDFMHSFYSTTAIGGPAAISQATLQGINSAPMFNPLSMTATIPGNSTGIVPTGLYLAGVQTGGMCGIKHQKGGGCGCQSGGSPVSLEELRSACNAHGISCRGQNGGYLQRKTLIKKLKGQMA